MLINAPVKRNFGLVTNTPETHKSISHSAIVNNKFLHTKTKDVLWYVTIFFHPNKSFFFQRSFITKFQPTL